MNFTPWKTITLGKKPNLKGIKISDYAKDMLDKVTYSKKKETIDLALVKVSELGIHAKYPTTAQIFEKAKELGLELCPAEVGPQLRAQYQDQPEDEWVYIAMEPITDRDGYPHVFLLARYGDGLWLYNHWAYPDRTWSPDYRFAFRFRQVVSLKPLDTSASELETQKGNLKADIAMQRAILDLQKRLTDLEIKWKRLEKAVTTK